MARFKLLQGKHETFDHDAQPNANGIYPDKTFYPGDTFIAEGYAEEECRKEPARYEEVKAPEGEWSFDPMSKQPPPAK